MKVEVDKERCAGAGMCALTDPEVFDQDEADGTVVLLDPSPSGEHQRKAREAAHLCPAGAIRVVE
ncbi:ferredoxin [Saccharothrix coeruleofusca]|uniref:Ferredoxin n=1 Tax=Saccharothrix coeruleofusca TaxID=33919 RepID=A0A918AID7_9PSEU|nr:ferredoxin [Saccharothrix coeruleofusca]MBP2334306.1 ferredoxin [Saccharothrix coeruleofusca]GGP41954.1 ferredoxin [Saccharothrix coeruleofusca]